MSPVQMDVVVRLSAHKDNGAVSADLVKQLETLQKKTEEIGKLQGKAVGGIGDLAENSLKIVSNLAQLAAKTEESSKAVGDAFEKIEKVVGILKGSADLFKNATEVAEALKQYAKAGEAGAEGGSLTKIASGGTAAAAGALGEAGGAAKGLTMLLNDMIARLGAAAEVAAPYAGLAVVTAGIYEAAVHILGAMGAVDVSSYSLRESYRGWQKAAKEAADSANEIQRQEEARQRNAEERTAKAKKDSELLDKRYDLIDGRRRHFELLGLGQGSNEGLQKFDNFDLADQSRRAAIALAKANATKGTTATVTSAPMSPEQEKEYDANAPGFWATLWHELAGDKTEQISKKDLTKLPSEYRVIASRVPSRGVGGEEQVSIDALTPRQKYSEEGAVKTQTIGAVPDYATAVKELERLEHLQERALETSKKEYEVLRDKSKELHSQVRQGEELVRQAHERIGVEEGRAESSVASFAKLDQKVRDSIVSISEKYKQTGKLSVEDAKYLDRYGMAPDLTAKTLAASVGGKERAALEIFGVFKGVDAAKEAEKKASEALTNAKNEEIKVTQQMNQLHHKMLGRDDAAFFTKQLISLIREQIGEGKVDRSGLAAPGPLRKGSKEAAEPQNELNRAQSEAIDRIKQLDDLSQKLWDSLTSAEQNSHQAALNYRDAINGVVQKDLLPAFTGAIRAMAAKLNNANA